MLSWTPTPTLSAWLLFVAALRLLSTVLGYRGPRSYRRAVFTGKPQEINALGARLFAAWTLLTSACCVACALDSSNRTVAWLTLFSFYVALAFFALEVAVFRTVRPRNSLAMVAVAGTSIAWLHTHLLTVR